ncbi:MAG: ATP-dependent DNA helicase DinG [Cellvibrionaceae bacterium]|jgi:ATP-dependent DNA helicase DinG
MLTNDLKSKIQSVYREFLASRELTPRYGQKLMIANIAKTLANINTDSQGVRIKFKDNADAKGNKENNKKSDEAGDKNQSIDSTDTNVSIIPDAEVQTKNPHLCIIEAGTGTGKTVAYLLAAIPIAQALKKRLVVSTATIALQEQIIQKDLPEIKNNTSLSFNFTLAKGRGRYLCLSKLDRILMTDDSSVDLSQSFLADDAAPADAQAITIYNSMVDAMSAGKWDGDRDSWTTEIDPAVWAPVTTNHRECTGRRCSNVNSCSFFKARDAIDKYDLIVANHDLVLADLALGGGAILPSPEDTIYIFDEGHHLPDKALNHFSYHTRVAATSKWLDQSHKVLSSMLGDISGAGNVDHYAEQLPATFLDAKQSLEKIYPKCQQLMDEQLSIDNDRNALSNNGFNKDSRRYRFEGGIPAAGFIELAEILSQKFDRLNSLLTQVSGEIQESMEDGYCSVPKVDLETWFPVVGSWQSRAEANLALWKSYSNIAVVADADKHKVIPTARWITLVEFSGAVDFEVCSSPILAANTLKYRLWEECFGAVVTSATLTALGRFDSFMMRSGTTHDQHYSVMPSPFDFSRATLQVPKFCVEANKAREHTESIVENLPSLLDEQKGCLVLFSSRKQMEEVFYQLRQSVRDKILMQGELSKQAMLVEHKKIITAGNSSVLFGLASFAEGVDLPGDFCSHVIIAKLPFAVPDDPIEASLAEWIESKGGNAFMDITVPDAAMKLVQACGRLLRKESDAGKITILDKRLITKRYGKLLLNCLPAYTVELGK